MMAWVGGLGLRRETSRGRCACDLTLQERPRHYEWGPLQLLGHGRENPPLQVGLQHHHQQHLPSSRTVAH